MRSTTIADLHEKVLDILCFLPPKSIINCSCVCKDWANLIYQPYFPHQYFLKQKPRLEIVLEGDHCKVVTQIDAALHRVSYPSEFSVLQKVIHDIDLAQGISSQVSWDRFQCNDSGWILAFSRRCSFGDPELYKLYQPWYYIYNPITGQHIVVQKATMYDDDGAWETGALIWAQKTNQLKLLVFNSKHTSGPVEAYVQTIGTNTWRRIGELPHYSGQDKPVLVNGMYHWLNGCNAVIHCFDPEEEKFQMIQTPVCVKNYDWPSLKSLDGCLCLELIIGDMRETWVMNKYGIQDSWSKI